LLTDLTPQRPVAHADRVQIEQVLINLIRNGLEAAMSANRRPEVTVGTSCDGESVQVAVSDNGSGISPQWEEQLFQPFVTDKPQGLGLGLSISRNIVEGHKGRMWVERNNQGGAVFKFTLPLRSSDEASA
jgi:two-component system sensor kinase FixL